MVSANQGGSAGQLPGHTAAGSRHGQRRVFLETDERQEKPQKYEKKIVDPPRRFDEKWVAVNVNNDPYNLGDNIEDFISLAAAIFNAVALAWTNETLSTELTVYTGDAKEESRARTIGILNEWLGYNYPWRLDLIVQEEKTAKYVPTHRVRT